MPGTPFLIRLRKLDIVGAGLFAGALSCGIIAISSGGSLFSWGDGTIIGLFDAAGFFWILFVLQQKLGISCDKKY